MTLKEQTQLRKRVAEVLGFNPVECVEAAVRRGWLKKPELIGGVKVVDVPKDSVRGTCAAAEFVGVSRQVMNHWMREQKVKPIRVAGTPQYGRRAGIYFRLEDLCKLKAERKQRNCKDP